MSVFSIEFKLILLLSALALVRCGNNSQETLDVSNPNIVLIISDDQAWTDYSFMGHDVIQTPRIDRLASQALTFTRGYVIAPLCRPSLASMATGLYPHQHGITGNDPEFAFEGRRYSDEWRQKRTELNKPFLDRFNQNPTIQSLLKLQGYQTFQTGKWWEGSHKDGGFDNGMTHGDWQRGGRHGDDGLSVGREGMEGLYDFMLEAKQNQKPFFVWHAPFMPHTPHTPPDSLLQKYEDKADHIRIARYMAMVEWFDITVGQLLDFLDSNDLAENTVVIYVCDNGWITNPNPETGNIFMPNSKQSPYDMGIRTPIMLRWPGKIKAETDTMTFVSSIDIAPTILKIAGMAQAENMSGIDLQNRAMLRSRKAIFAEDFMHDMKDLKTPSASLESRIILSSPWKLIVPFIPNNDKELELFNILEDPHELRNLNNEYPTVVEELTSELDRFWKPEAPSAN